MKKLLTVLVIVANIGRIQGQDVPAQFEVSYAGALKMIMHEGDISSKADLRVFQDQEHVYALGALGNLKGEILILDGKPCIATVEQENLNIDTSYHHKAALLIHTRASNWQTQPIADSINTREELEMYLEAAAAQSGIDTANPFPFMITGKIQTLDWHVVNWPDSDMVHTHEKHKLSGLNGRMVDMEVVMLGFYSKHHHGIFTHHMTNTHMHVLSADKALCAHVDDFKPGGNMTLILPDL